MPESWLDIMKPEYKGKVAMVDDPLGNLLIWGTVVTGKPMGTILTKAEMAQVIDKLIDIKKNHARAWFASYGDMADAFARNEVVVTRHRLGSGRGLGQGQGQDDQIHHPQGGHGHVHGLPLHPQGQPASRSDLQDDQPYHLAAIPRRSSPPSRARASPI